MVTEDAVKQIAAQLNLRIKRAVDLGDALDAEIVAWRQSHPLDVEVNVKADGMGWSANVVKFDPEPPLAEWGIRFAEIANHLRSVLNTMLTRICIAEGFAPTKRLQFPIAIDRKAWVGKSKNNGERDRLAGIPERVQRIIYGNQPFVMARLHGKSAKNDVLAVLAWTDNQFKHSLELEGLFNPGPFVHYFRPTYLDRSIDPDKAEVMYKYDYSMAVGSALVDADTTPNVVSDVAMDMDLVMDIGFLDDVGGNTPYRIVLEEFRQKVQDIVTSVLLVWRNEQFDVNQILGSTDFQPGAAFGRAAVNQLAGDGTWESDFLRSEAGRKARLRDRFIRNLQQNQI